MELLTAGKIDQKEAGKRLAVSVRQIKRIVRHYSIWPETKLPALNGKTPLQAVKTCDGREMVEALLLNSERRSKQAAPPLDLAIIAELRERLGLD